MARIDGARAKTDLFELALAVIAWSVGHGGDEDAVSRVELDIVVAPVVTKGTAIAGEEAKLEAWRVVGEGQALIHVLVVGWRILDDGDQAKLDARCKRSRAAAVR